MSEVNFVDNWSDVDNQCRQCKSFKVEGGKSSCVPDGKTFVEAVTEYGECPPTGHCDSFETR